MQLSNPRRADVQPASRQEYDALKRRLGRGWNTWNTRSLLSHVLLPEGFALDLCVKEYGKGGYLKDVQVHDAEDGYARPGPHQPRGRYTEITLRFNDHVIRVESAHADEDLVLLVTPLEQPEPPALLVLESGVLWNKPGTLRRDGNCLILESATRSVAVHSTGRSVRECNVFAQTPYLSVAFDGPVGFSTGAPRSLRDIKELVGRAREECATEKSRWGSDGELFDAIRSVLSWDTIYEPQRERVISPVSRQWCADYHGGYVLFTWDTCFAAMLSTLVDKDVACANLVEIVSEHEPQGFLPAMPCNLYKKGIDRSQPPLAALAAHLIYDRFREPWLLEQVFDDLVRWNTWYLERRQLADGCMAWGYELENCTSDNARLESGLDNSSMYDDIPVAIEGGRALMQLADVGLTSLMALDSRLLASMASELGRTSATVELTRRAERLEAALRTLYCPETGLFLNRRADTGEFSKRLSPTLFYPLLTNVVSDAQAQRMLTEHLYNPEEFWGEWVLPSVPRNDAAFADQDYWRGRIWPPMNFLVYLGLHRQNLPAARDLAEKCRSLFLEEWRERRHIHENYSALSGSGCPVAGEPRSNSDPYYHWGALLALIPLIESGAVRFELP